MICAARGSDAAALLAGDRQRGAVLVVGLVFLVLMTLIGITAYSVANQEEPMAGHARDRLRAFEAAEAALRECEDYLGRAAAPNFSSDGSADPGMYEAPAAGRPDIADAISWNSSPTRQLSGISGVAEQPRCIVQRIGSASTSAASLRAELPQPDAFAYQVTARGIGVNRGTAVVLQTTFIRN